MHGQQRALVLLERAGALVLLLQVRQTRCGPLFLGPCQQLMEGRQALLPVSSCR